MVERLEVQRASEESSESEGRAREEAGVLLLPWSAFGGFGGGALGKKGPPGPPAWIEGRFRLGLGGGGKKKQLEKKDQERVSDEAV